MGHGKGWSEVESRAACKSYIMASEDPRNGNGKKREVFHSEVLALFEKELSGYDENKLFPKRTGAAIAQRYRKARCECLKFEGIILRIRSKKPTGSPSQDDIERAALAVYNSEANVSDMYSFLIDKELSPGPKFPFCSALKFLRTTHTWDMVVDSVKKSSSTVLDTSKEDTGRSSDQSSAGGGGSVTPFTERDGEKVMRHRPTGTKRASELKEQIDALNRGAVGIENMAAASAKRNKVAEEMLAVDKQRVLIQLFSMDGTDPDLRQRFLTLKQKKAVLELESELGAYDAANAQSVDHDDGNIISTVLEGTDVGTTSCGKVLHSSGAVDELDGSAGQPNNKEGEATNEITLPKNGFVETLHMDNADVEIAHRSTWNCDAGIRKTNIGIQEAYKGRIADLLN